MGSRLFMKQYKPINQDLDMELDNLNNQDSGPDRLGLAMNDPSSVYQDLGTNTIGEGSLNNLFETSYES